MRKNVARVMQAWCDNKSLDMGSIGTDGESIFSYATCIVTKRTGPNAAVIVNRTSYSVTTSQQQGSICAALSRHNGYIEVSGLNRGATAEDLKHLASVTS